MEYYDLAAKQRGFLDRRQALDAGLTDRQIERLTKTHWQRPHPGVYRPGAVPLDWEDEVRAACLAAGGDARAMGRTGARVRGLDGAEDHRIIELTVSRLRGPVPRGVRVHLTRRCNPALTTHIRGIPVSSINQLLVEYAWLVRPDLPVERAVEDALRRGYTSEGTLRRFLAQCGKGVNGVRHLRAVLDARPEGRPARTGFEVILIDIFREYGVPLPTRRPLVPVPPDRMFELDLAYLDKLIDIEAMGAKWHATAHQRRADDERRRVLRALGWHVEEVWWDEAIHRPADIAARVLQAYQSR
jgi:hypothetical protein